MFLVCSFDSFLNVRQVIFRSFVLEVGQQVLEACNRPAMIERPLSIGKDEQQTSTRLNDPEPFKKRANWIGSVLQHVRGKNKVARFAGDGKRDGVPVIGPTDPIPVLKRWPCLKAVIGERGNERIDGDLSPRLEHDAGAADLDSVAPQGSSDQGETPYPLRLKRVAKPIQQKGRSAELVRPAYGSDQTRRHLAKHTAPCG